MPAFLFKAVQRNPQTGQAIPVPVGARTGFVINFPGNMEQAKQYARANAMGSPGVRYLGVELTPNLPEPMVLCVEINMGVSTPVQGPQISAAHVNGGQPVGAPMGNVNQNRSTQQADSSGFQTLGDDVLSGAGDNLFGDAEHGTVSDLYGGGHFEAPRQ